MPEASSSGMCGAIESTVSYFYPDGVEITATASKDGLSGSVIEDVGSNQSKVHLAIDLDIPPCSDEVIEDTGNFGSFTYAGAASGEGSGDEIQYFDTPEQVDVFNIQIGDEPSLDISFNVLPPHGH